MSEPRAAVALAGLEEVEVHIEKLVAGGEGLARYDGVPLFVPRSAPGDRLRVRLTERRPDYGRAEIVEIVEPGPGRRPDPFPELSRSGACDLQHLEDGLQPLLKAAAVKETVERLGKVKLPAEVGLVTGAPWRYRLRTQLHTAVDPVAGGVQVGYHARGTNEVIPLTRCPLLVPELEELLPILTGTLSADSLPKRLDLAAGDRGVTVAPLLPDLPHGEVATAVGDFTYSYDARCFFQSHRGLLPQLVAAAVGPWEGEEAFDLYSGVGLFSLPLARRYGKVTAVESEPIAVRYARNNARRAKVPGWTGVAQVVESWIDRLPTRPARVLVDPPRAGLAAKVRRALVACRPERLTYVSCHAATLARDLRQLDPAFRLDSLTLFDLFPQTGHMEAVAQLSARE